KETGGQPLSGVRQALTQRPVQAGEWVSLPKLCGAMDGGAQASHGCAEGACFGRLTHSPAGSHSPALVDIGLVFLSASSPRPGNLMPRARGLIPSDRPRMFTSSPSLTPASTPK